MANSKPSSEQTGQSTPLLFVNKTTSNYNTTRQDVKRVASHVSSSYRPWKKGRKIDLDNTTRAILDSNKRRKVHAAAEESARRTDASSVHGSENSSDSSSAPSAIFSPRGTPGYSQLSAPSSIVARDLDSGSGDFCGESEHTAAGERPFLPSAEQSSEATAFVWSILKHKPRLSLLGHHSLDPFSRCEGAELDTEVKSNVHFYFKLIRPFAKHLIEDWQWCDSVPQIQSSKALLYAVAAYGSLFFSGCLRGGPGVVLPPPVKPGQRPAWPNPPWLTFQTMCVSELSAQLQRSGIVDESSFTAMLFLFRISVLLADGPSARMHAKALRKLGSSALTSGLNLNTELAVAKVNIISAFLHHKSMVVVKQRPDHTKKQLSHVVELVEQGWHRPEQPWYAKRSLLTARVFAWRAEEPASSIHDRTSAELLRIDPNISLLDKRDQHELAMCYQIGLFLTHILHCISFNTSNPRIRSNTLLLKEKIMSIDIQSLQRNCPNLLFNLFFSGAVASYCYVERFWFIGHLSLQFPEVRFLNEVKAMMLPFIDPMTLIPKIIDDVWTEVLKLRVSPDKSRKAYELWEQGTYWSQGRDRPWKRSPNLSRPNISAVYVERAVNVEPEFNDSDSDKHSSVAAVLP